MMEIPYSNKENTGEATSQITFNKLFAINKRDLFFVLLSVGSVFLFILFLALYASYSTPEERSVWGKGSSQIPNKCTTAPCLETAAYLIQNMNTSVDPCQDFYEYSCGGWKSRNRIPPGQQIVTPWRKKYADNIEKLRRILEAPTRDASEWSFERKVKDFWSSCLDQFGRNKVGADPFIKNILSKLGGTYILGDWDEEAWTLNKQLQKVQSYLFTPTFFSVSVIEDSYEPTQRIVSIKNAGLSMSRDRYSDDGARDFYKSYIRSIVSLVVRDNPDRSVDEDTQTTRINTFIDDIMTFETEMARVLRNSSRNVDQYGWAERVTLKDLTAQTNDVIDFVALVRGMFTGTTFSEEYKVSVSRMEFLVRMSTYITGLGDQRARVLENFFVWRLAGRYMAHLSWEFLQAEESFIINLYGRTSSGSRYDVIRTISNDESWQLCKRTLETYVPDMLSALFVMDHFADASKTEMKAMTHETLKLAETFPLPWMDQETREIVNRKLSQVIYKHGYPAYMVDRSEMDSRFKDLQIDKDDYFKNIIEMKKFQQESWTDDILKGFDMDDQWYGATYETYVNYNYLHGILYGRAGAFQFPEFILGAPSFYNFGRAGRFLNYGITFSLIAYGSQFLDGAHYKVKYGKKSYWTKKTSENYKKLENCLRDQLNNHSVGPYEIDGEPKAAKLEVQNVVGRIAQQGSSKLAHKDFCTLSTQEYQYDIVKSGNCPSELRAKSLVLNNVDFAPAFNCALRTPMNPEKKCSFY